jgi:hypothetical protein
MAFTRGLYYPGIEFRDEGWVRSALLYWDSLHTIVPGAIERPYGTPLTRRLYEEGLLDPVYVRPDASIVDSLTEQVLEYLNSPEGMSVVSGIDARELVYLHPEKLPRGIRDFVHIHPDKLPGEARTRLQTELRGEEWVAVDRGFAAFYMTLLASGLAGEFGFGLLTDTPGMHRLGSSAAWGHPASIAGSPGCGGNSWRAPLRFVALHPSLVKGSWRS